jgi:hypothetical protein
MPAWIVLSLPDLNEYKVAELVEALRTEALAQGQVDPMPGIIGDAGREIRAAIAHSGAYTLDATADSIPSSLRGMGAKKVVREMKGRLEIALTEPEKKDEETYEKRLVALTKGAWPVEKPDTPLSPAPVQAPASSSPRIKPKRRQATRRQFDGI